VRSIVAAPVFRGILARRHEADFSCDMVRIGASRRRKARQPRHIATFQVMKN
jgi:hypothetical protein